MPFFRDFLSKEYKGELAKLEFYKDADIRLTLLRRSCEVVGGVDVKIWPQLIPRLYPLSESESGFLARMLCITIQAELMELLERLDRKRK